MFLHSGRLLPSSEEAAQCGEGVGILLSPEGVNAWHAAGDAWSAVSSRIVTARLKLASVGMRQAGGGRCSSDIYLTVISAYAPTFRAPSHIKEAFWNDLQRCLAVVPDSDKLLMLGDFNARVGYHRSEGDVWSGVLGYYGLDVRNQAGEDFLHFCEINQLSIMNTWFQKSQYYGSWIHPAIVA